MDKVIEFNTGKSVLHRLSLLETLRSPKTTFHGAAQKTIIDNFT